MCQINVVWHAVISHVPSCNVFCDEMLCKKLKKIKSYVGNICFALMSFKKLPPQMLCDTSKFFLWCSIICCIICFTLFHLLCCLLWYAMAGNCKWCLFAMQRFVKWCSVVMFASIVLPFCIFNDVSCDVM
jgi:hypothetical protein